jgi:parallel beta-helix repeat protein
MSVTAGGFTLEDVAIEDTKGDGLKVNGADGVTLRRVRAEWTNGPNEKNGSYGLYPVQCKNVLIEDSVVKGAADAGIYVGQSKNIIVRRNRVEYNVAGIEIENSTNADAYENAATNNTGGMLVFNLPDLPVKGGRDTRFFNNQVYANNTDNFAPKGNMVANVPAGTGMIVLAASHVEVFKNTIRDNNSANVSIISYFTTGNPMKDASYDPYNHAINVHDNTVTGGGAAPAGLMASRLGSRVAKPLPGILYDGIADPKSKGEEAQICIQNNGDAGFMNYDAGHSFKNISRDATPHACSLPSLAEVTIPVVTKAGLGGAN